MRVIAGSAKGHTLKSPKGWSTRPTLDRVREAVFNVLAPRLKDSVFLDLYSGTGAVGVEALSRGAAVCYFNDSDKKSFTLIKENITRCGFFEKSRIFNSDALKLLNYLEADENLVFDIIYLDPPYESKSYQTLLINLGKSRLLGEDTLLIFESGRETQLCSTEELELQRSSRYGDTIIWYFKPKIINGG